MDSIKKFHFDFNKNRPFVVLNIELFDDEKKLCYLSVEVSTIIDKFALANSKNLSHNKPLYDGDPKPIFEKIKSFIGEQTPEKIVVVFDIKTLISKMYGRDHVNLPTNSDIIKYLSSKYSNDFKNIEESDDDTLGYLNVDNIHNWTFDKFFKSRSNYEYFSGSKLAKSQHERLSSTLRQYLNGKVFEGDKLNESIHNKNKTMKNISVPNRLKLPKIDEFLSNRQTSLKTNEEFGDEISKINDWFKKTYDESDSFEWDGENLIIKDSEGKKKETITRADLTSKIDGFPEKVNESRLNIQLVYSGDVDEFIKKIANDSKSSIEDVKKELIKYLSK